MHINIGDYIQSIAARQFLCNPSAYLHREHLDKYQGEPVRIIMNAWYMHRTGHFPPSDNIVPLPISMHINSAATDIMLTPESIAWFKVHEPIGCRDLYTVRLLEGQGIRAYFSGCLTLTLGKTYHRVNPGNTVYFVDPWIYADKRDTPFIIRTALFCVTHLKLVKHVRAKKYRKKTLRSTLLAAAFCRQYRALVGDRVLLEAEYITHDYPPGHDDRYYIAEAERLLALYAQAKSVITSRIHCALPCTGIGTPVVYIHNDNADEGSLCRMDGLLELLNVVRFDKGRCSNTAGIDLLHPPLKNAHLALKEALMRTCHEFAQGNHA